MPPWEEGGGYGKKKLSFQSNKLILRKPNPINHT